MAGLSCGITFRPFSVHHVGLHYWRSPRRSSSPPRRSRSSSSPISIEGGAGTTSLAPQAPSVVDR